MIIENSALNPCKNADLIKEQCSKLLDEFSSLAKVKENQLLVIGCSSSEIIGNNIGHGSSLDAAKAVFEVVYPYAKEKGLLLAIQCCEHLNRCLIVEKTTAEKFNLPIVNVRPQPKAGGSFATTAFENFNSPVAVENIQADLGIDIGQTLIGMHLKPVAVPLRLKNNKIGEALVTCARTRPKFIGGIRAAYNEELL